MDVCPVCKNKITEEHVHTISKETAEKIELLNREIKKSDEQLGEIFKKKKMIREEIENMNSEISKRESDIILFQMLKIKKIR